MHRAILVERYLRGVAHRLGGYPVQFRHAATATSDPLDLVKLAVDESRSERRKGSAFDDVWCVIESHEAPSQRELEDAASRGVMLAWCRPSVERYLLLHHSEAPPTLSVDEIQARLAPVADASLAGLHDRALARAREDGMDNGQLETAGILEITEAMREATRRFRGSGDLPPL